MKKEKEDVWFIAAQKAVDELANDGPKSLKDIKKALRSNLTKSLGHRASKDEVKNLQMSLQEAGVISISKSTVKIGEWKKAADIAVYNIDPKKVDRIKKKRRELKILMSIQRGGLPVSSSWHNGTVLKSFRTFSIIEFVLNQETADDSRKFGSALEELSRKQIGYSFDIKTNPDVVRIVEQLMELL